MCGIVGYIGSKDASPILLSALRRLEYRGYDSAGMVTVNGSGLHIEKDIGKIDDVDSKVSFSSMKGTVGLAHSRWATHGRVTQENAHPHTYEGIAIIHNGIIENFSSIKKNLEEKGHTFSSETDSEVIVHLIASLYESDLFTAVQSAMKQLEGAYSLGVISEKEPTVLIAARNESPLIIGVGEGENFIASDVPAILEHTNKIIYLDNGQAAKITAKDITVVEKGTSVEPHQHTISWSAERAEKGGFEHFMLKEIFDQPDAIIEALDGRISDDHIDIGLDLNVLKDVKRIIIIGCGTSWHAGLLGEFMLEELSRIPTEVEYASEFRYRDPIIEDGTLIIAISQSGETADTLAAMREAKRKGARILSITNSPGNSIQRESDYHISMDAGPEIGVASTKAFMNMSVILYLLTVQLGHLRNHIDLQQVKNRIRDVRMLPLQIKAMCDEHEHIKELAKRFSSATNALFLGRGINFPIALEGALKLKEVSYVHAEGYPAAEMKHGPIALIDEKMPTVVIATKDDRTHSKVMSNISEIKARGGRVIGITTKGDNESSNSVDYSLPVPENSYILSPLLATVPAQLFAYYMALERGNDPDKPKNLAKSVTVE